MRFRVELKPSLDKTLQSIRSQGFLPVLPKLGILLRRTAWEVLSAKMNKTLVSAI